MKRAGIIFLAALLGVLGWIFFPKKQNAPPPRERIEPAKTLPASAVSPEKKFSAPPAQTAPLLGENILRGYGTPASTPEHDLTLMAHLMDNFTLLVKASAQLPMSVNEDWAAAFRGLNPAHERFLPDTHVAFDAQGRLVDRWRTPLFFHALGGHRYEIRSAGPDKKMWTADDIHRNADGSFLHGPALTAPSLLEASPTKTGR